MKALFRMVFGHAEARRGRDAEGASRSDERRVTSDEFAVENRIEATEECTMKKNDSCRVRNTGAGARGRGGAAGRRPAVRSAGAWARWAAVAAVAVAGTLLCGAREAEVA